MRRKLVELLKTKGIKDEGVLDAISEIPRHFFLENAFLKFAYEDQAFQIGAGQTISQPYTVAFQSELLEIKKGDKILEIGTGSGYQTAVLAHMGAKVFSIERQKELHTKSKLILDKMGYRARLYFGDGFEGIPSYAPFDKAIITCGAPFIPENIIDQLKIGGKLVIPIGEGETQQMTLITRVDNQKITRKTFGEFRFVPMLENKNYNR